MGVGGCCRRNLTEEEHGEETDGKGDDGEHDEEGRWVIGKQSSTEVSENGGTKADIAFENTGNRAAILSEVPNTGYQNRRVHPRGAVSAQTQKETHLFQRTTMFFSEIETATQSRSNSNSL